MPGTWAVGAVGASALALRRIIFHPEPGMRPASIGGTVSLIPHYFIMIHRIQDRRQEPAPRIRPAPKPVQDELRDRCVTDNVSASEHLQVPGYRGLGELQDSLQVGDEQGSGRQAVENAQPGRLGHSEQERGGCGSGRHMRLNEYRRSSPDASPLRSMKGA